jgi:hypothetical protein
MCLLSLTKRFDCKTSPKMIPLHNTYEQARHTVQRLRVKHLLSVRDSCLKLYFFQSTACVPVEARTTFLISFVCRPVVRLCNLKLSISGFHVISVYCCPPMPSTSPHSHTPDFVSASWRCRKVPGVFNLPPSTYSYLKLPSVFSFS